MSLIFVILLICLVLSFAHLITKPVIAYMLSPNAQQRKITKNIAELRQKLTTINRQAEYTAYVRIERQIAAAERDLAAFQGSQVTRTLLVRYGISYGSQVLLSIVLFGISVFYRYVPVIVLDERFNMTPFGWLMRFPTGISGAISVPFWIFVSSFVSKGVASVCGQ